MLRKRNQKIQLGWEVGGEVGWKVGKEVVGKALILKTVQAVCLILKIAQSINGSSGIPYHLVDMASFDWATFASPIGGSETRSENLVWLGGRCGG